MDDKFRLGKTIYLVILFVLVIGILFGFINSNYILKFLPKDTVVGENRDQPKITRLSKTAINQLEKETYLLIYNDQDPESIALKDNINQTLLYMKKEVNIVKLSEIPVSFNHYKNIIIAFEQVSKIPNLSKLEIYTAKGGKVFFAIRPEKNDNLQNLYRKLGTYEVGDFITPKGIKLTSNVLINQKDLKMNDGEITDNSSLQIGLNDHSKIYMKSIDQVPLLWDTPYKKGKFMIFNGTMLSTKESRGLITGALSLLNEEYIYPIMNMKVAFIDDFPSPVPEGKNKVIYDEYRRNISSFYEDIWWPDIIKGASKYNVKYTGGVIQTYEDKVTPPFSSDSHEKTRFVQFGRELLKMGGEIGIHGYNHQSLTINPKAVEDLNYNAWHNQGDMEESLKTTENYMKKLFPNYTLKTYIPPSNRIDSVGEAALHHVIPSIKILSSLYLPDEIEYSTVHEFEKGKYFTHLPRITSGFQYTKQMKWAMENGITSIGVFSHFIHPDDVLDVNRSSKKNWEELEKEYNHLLRDIYSNYPWLKSRTASNAGIQLNNYLNAEVYIKEHSDRITVNIDRFAGEMSFVLRTQRKIAKLQNCVVRKIDQDVYFVEAKKATFEIGLVD